MKSFLQSFIRLHPNKYTYKLLQLEDQKILKNDNVNIIEERSVKTAGWGKINYLNWIKNWFCSISFARN